MSKKRNRSEEYPGWAESDGDNVVTTGPAESNGEAESNAVDLGVAVPVSGSVVSTSGVDGSSHLDLSRCRTSLDLSDPMSRFKLFNATGVATIELPDNGDVTIRAQDWIIHHVVQTDPETGEVKDYDRLVLISDQGETFATTSEVVMARLFQLLSLFDGVHFDSPVLLNISQKTGRRSRRTWQDLRVIVG